MSQGSVKSKTASRARFFAAQSAAKVARGCARCGYRENPDALEFDHAAPLLHPGQSRPRHLRVDSMRGLAAALGNPNVQVLCGNCHNIKTVGEKRGRALCSK